MFHMGAYFPDSCLTYVTKKSTPWLESAS
jgi:hypothetical protein